MHIREIVLDTETTGLSLDHRVIEIGAVELIDRKRTGRIFHRYIKPQRKIDAGAFMIHGISEEFLADKPIFAEIANAFLDFIQDSNLVIHNAAFDSKFLNKELGLIQLKQIDKARLIDTLVISREMYPGAKASLNALCERFNIPLHREKHGALLDAELLTSVYLAMTTANQLAMHWTEEEHISANVVGNCNTIAEQIQKHNDSDAIKEWNEIRRHSTLKLKDSEIMAHEKFLLANISDPVWSDL